MKKFHCLFVAIFFICSTPFSFAAEGKKPSQQEENNIKKKAKKICDGMVPVYGFALDLFFKKNNAQKVRSEVIKRIELDTKKNIFYTKYLETPAVADAILSVTAPHAKMIMDKYPGDQEIYKQSIKITTDTTLPPVCQSDISDLFRKEL